MKTQSKTSNHEKAPLCAAFVKEMREVFGPITVERVREGEVNLGEDDLLIYAPCIHVAEKK